MPVNRAYDKPASTIHPKLTEHSMKMEQRVYQVTENYYLAYGYGLASTHMIVGTDGIIIIDPVECVVKCRRINDAFREITDKPIQAVIYTHMHGDHLFGVKGFISDEEVASGQCKVIAHETMLPNLLASSSIGPGNVLFRRTGYTVGSLLELGPEGRVNAGIGPDILVEEISFIPPTITVQDTLDIEIAGVKMHIIWVPSECDDEIAVWFPETKVLCTAEVIQGETFPNLHTIRGTRYRDPKQWYQSIDFLRSFDADYMAPSHGRPVYGKENVADILTAYRDAIQFVHNQTIRYMNQGYTPDELVHLIKLPGHLAQHPWLEEYYGTVKHAVREIYQGELGWFNGDPTTLDPIPPVESSTRHVELMGGRDKMVQEAAKSLEAGDYQWAAELMTYVIRTNKQDMEARRIKAESLRQLGYQTLNINWRNWYLTSAHELEGKEIMAQGQAGAGFYRSLPSASKVEALCFLLSAEKSLDINLTVVFQFPKMDQQYALEIRRGIAQFHPVPPEKVDARVTVEDHFFADMVSGLSSLDEGLKTGNIKVIGDVDVIKKFFSCFEKPIRRDEIFLTLR